MQETFNHKSKVIVSNIDISRLFALSRLVLYRLCGIVHQCLRLHAGAAMFERGRINGTGLFLTRARQVDRISIARRGLLAVAEICPKSSFVARHLQE